MDLENKNTKEIIDERFKSLPTEIQDAITNSKWIEKIRFLVKKYNLRIDQGASLETIVFLTMLGLISPQDMYSEIEKEIGLEKENLNKIIFEIENEIFKEIKNYLIEIDKKEATIEENNQNIILGIKGNTQDKNLATERENILKEIEDPEENQVKPNNSLMIEPDIQTPSTNVNTPEQNQKIIEQDMKKTSPSVNNVAQKLQTPTVSAPKTVKIDPYREIPE